MGAPARELEREVMLEASRLGARLFKNVRGFFRNLYTDTKQKAGLMCDGSSDLIGWTSVIVTPDMVGKRIAIFTAAEDKAGKDTVKPEQADFMRLVREAGGIAGVVRSVEDLRTLLTPENKR